jgi:IS4 transposase
MNCQHKFRFKNKLLSFDASVIDLCLSMYDWAHFRRTKGAIKLHLLLDHAGYLPEFVNISTGKVHEINVLKTLDFQPGTIIVFDRGLIDYQQWGVWTDQGVYFLTWLKSNASYKVVKSNQITPGKHIVKDQIIKLEGFYSKKKCPHYLRLVEKYNPEEDDKPFTFVTNNLNLAASTIAAIYKERWQIETFFKAIKQNLRIKTFVGTSFNAVMIQIWTALIAILILKYLQAKSKMNWSLSNLVAMLRMNLLTYKDLWECINHPYFKPPAKPESIQQCLDLK